MEPRSQFRTFLIALLVICITLLDYSTKFSLLRYHIFYQDLYFLPIILAGFWFGLREALVTSSIVTILYLPVMILHWKGFSPWDFNELLDIALYNGVAFVLGKLRNREKAEQRRSREAERLAAMGKGVSGLAHDLKTPLIAIGGFSRNVRKKLPPGSPLLDPMDLIVEESRRLENMVAEILDFSRPLELHRSRNGIEDLISKCMEIVRGKAEERKVQVRIRESKAVPPAFFDSARMRQVLINLLVNAIEASPEGEVVNVAYFQKKRSLVLEVVDRGCGIPPQKKEEIFFPFFTTKSEGTGLGLPIARKIVEAHGGTLEVLDNSEKGTIFRVRIPL